MKCKQAVTQIFNLPKKYKNNASGVNVWLFKLNTLAIIMSVFWYDVFKISDIIVHCGILPKTCKSVPLSNFARYMHCSFSDNANFYLCNF